MGECPTCWKSPLFYGELFLVAYQQSYCTTTRRVSGK